MSYKRIVVGTDGSETAEKAVSKAIELADSLGAKLDIASAVEPVHPSQMQGLNPDSSVVDQPSPGSSAERLVAGIADQASDAGIDVDTWIRTGDAAGTLIDVAIEVGSDLVVVGNRGMTGLSRFLMGSVSNKITHHAPCDVLVVRTQD